MTVAVAGGGLLAATELTIANFPLPSSAVVGEATGQEPTIIGRQSLRASVSGGGLQAGADDNVVEGQPTDAQHQTDGKLILITR